MAHITSHGDTLIQITRLAMFNCYLVRESDGFTLVDTGLSGSADLILNTAAQFQLPIRRITLTHPHIDHVGSVDALCERLPQAEFSLSVRDSRFLTGDKSLNHDEPQTPPRGGFPLVRAVPHRLLKEGDFVGSLEVIESPGHTPGHIAFFDHRDRTLIAGDAYTTQAGTSTAGTLRLLFPFPAMATWHKVTALQSARRLLTLNPSRLAVGHGKVIENPADAMRSAIKEAAHKLEATHG